ncbi:hypothetical protein CERSUDRAFT_97093 [Gelatoporia subvermispora B]|uniref:SMP domain-containing protein n=1 Tax=Ceriporiopsis subvermispora (strain B) TaxID=914234 RepID=M2QT02_CERS8|nr:hypothetical protein CERSUDRAFT_97093 [Gelatoporia subvermispora B]
MSSNAESIMAAAHLDASRFSTSRVDLKNIGEAEARKLMSAEHKALGYRPPPGSLAAEAQSAAAKHPEAKAGVPEQLLKQAAIEDAERIRNERENTNVNPDALGEAGARKLMSEEHKALGYRPPPGSLAAEAQSAASKHPDGAAHPATHDLQRAALEDAAKIKEANAQEAIRLDKLGQAEARKLMSEEHKALGYRPPPGSLAAEAQSAAAKHPDASVGVDTATLSKAALEDAKKIESQRNGTSPTDAPELNLDTISAPETRALQSEEQKTLGYRPPSDSLTAQAQSVVDSRANEPVTKDLSSTIQSEEHKALGHRPETGTLAATAQSLADKNEADGGDRKLGDVGL